MLKLTLKSGFQTIFLGLAIVGLSGVNKTAQANNLNLVSVAPPSSQQPLPSAVPAGDISTLDEYVAKHADVYSESFLLTEFNYENFCSSNPKHNICADYKPNTIKQEENNKTPKDPSVTQEATPIEVTQEQPNPELSGWAINPEISTMGLGGSIVKSLNPNFNVRLGGYGFSLGGISYEDTQVKYEGDVGLLNIPALLDWYPWEESGFRLSAGAVFYDNRVNSNGVPKDNSTFTINEVTYSTQELGALSSSVSWGSGLAPYIGIGWGNPVRKGQNWNFSINLGAFFPGSPDVSVTPTFGNIPQSLQNEILSNLEVERQELENSIKWLNIYPVLSIGFSYQF